MSIQTFKKDRQGFSVIEAVIALAIIGLVVFMVMNIVSSNSETSDDGAEVNNDPVPTIDEPQDLENAEDALEDVDLDSLDDSELDADVEELL